MFLVVASIPMAAEKEHPAHSDHPEHLIVPRENTQHLRDNSYGPDGIRPKTRQVRYDCGKKSEHCPY